MRNNVTAIPAAASADALAHFQRQFAYETDCWDTHDALQKGEPGFVLLDVRSPVLYAQGHVPGAINLPHGKIIESKLAPWPADTLFVTYCAGPRRPWLRCASSEYSRYSSSARLARDADCSPE